MTVTEAPEESPDASSDESRRAGRSIVVRLLWRWLALIALTVLAYWHNLGQIAREIVILGSDLDYIVVVLVLATMAAYGVTLRRSEERAIRDRQTDIIVGVIVMLLSFCFAGALTNRFTGSLYLLTHLDLLGLWTFFFGGCILMFGLRPAMRYHWVWLFGLAASPIVYRIALLSLGGNEVAAGIVMTALGAFAAAIAVGRDRRSALVGFVAAGVVGLVIIAVVRAVRPSAPLLVYQALPAVGSVFVVGLIAYLRRRRRTSPRPFDRPLYEPGVDRVKVGAAAVLVVSAVITLLLPYQRVVVTPTPTIAGLNTRAPLIVPDAWRQDGPTLRYDWVGDFYGPGAVLARQNLLQQTGDVAFDKEARPRKLIADTIETRYPFRFDLYPLVFTYDLFGDRFSAPVLVMLPHGIPAVLEVILDDTRYLTYTVLSWQWGNGEHAQKVALWSVDNHEPDAYFPQPDQTILKNLRQLFNVTLRGDAVIRDDQPDFKDRQLLLDAGRDVVNAQLSRVRREDQP